MGMKVKLRELFINSYTIVQPTSPKVKLCERGETMKTMTHKTK